MARRMIFASAFALLAAACTHAPSGAATPGDSTSVAPTPSASSSASSSTPSAQPAVPVRDQRAPHPARDTTPDAGATGSRAGDSAHVAALEHAAVALARTTGCSSDGQCRNAPVGVKACGGARYYLKYCAASTDSVALFRALARLDAAERAYNARYHVVSTCQMILPTRPHLVGGACH